MRTDAEIRRTGLDALVKALGPVEADAAPRGFVELRPPRRASGVCVEAGRWLVRVKSKLRTGRMSAAKAQHLAALGIKA